MAAMIDFHSEEYLLGQRIQQVRKQRGLSQTQLGNLLDMDRAAISNYENGSKGEMGFKTLKRFADALGVKTSVLLGENEEKKEGSKAEILNELSDENLDIILKMAEALKLKQTMSA